MKKYDIIYADPPWEFVTYSPKGKIKKSPETHYSCMSLEDIFHLPVNNLSSDNSILFLWVTNPLLPQGLQTIKEWGFTYKTVAFSWYKLNKKADTFFFGLGYWTRANTELVLLATKGLPKRVSKNIPQVVSSYWNTEQIVSRIQDHSRKPDEVRSRITQLCGDLPRIELFARNPYNFPGWDVFGNEVDNSISLSPYLNLTP